VAFIPTHLPWRILSSEAFLLSSWRSHKLLCNDNQVRSLTRCSLSDVESYAEISQNIRECYNENETDGVLEFGVSSSIIADSKLDIEKTLIPAILDASRGNNGVAASIMNALIGSSCILTNRYNTIQNQNFEDPLSQQDCVKVDDKNLSCMSNRILLLIEGLKNNGDVVPDIVTYSLAHQFLSLDLDCSDMADQVLEEAVRKSKKVAGGKRRKLLAQARRQKVSTFIEAEENLKEILGGDFRVLLETDGFAVVNKPSGVPCFHKKMTTAGKIKRGAGKRKKGKVNKKDEQLQSSDISLEDALVSCNVKLSTLNPEALGLVHRLDRGTSGCMVLAKSNEMHTLLVSEFFLRRTKKKYLALVQESRSSSVSKDGHVLIEIPVNGRPAKSEYRLLERYQFMADNDDEREAFASLLEFEIFTGRKHQIRIHAAEALKSPVWGDSLYNADFGNGEIAKHGSDSNRIFLHACHLLIPKLGIDVESPIPEWWQPKLRALRSNSVDDSEVE